MIKFILRLFRKKPEINMYNKEGMYLFIKLHK